MKRALVGCAAVVLAGTTSCGGEDSGTTTLTLYNAQHVELVQIVVDAFTEETGIAVEIRSGSDAELANQIVQEGEASPADVFVTENSPAMSLVDNGGLLAPVDQETLDQLPGEYTASNGNWLGFAARATVLVYNPGLMDEAELPTSILGLADPEWEGRVGIAAGGADFQAIVSAVLSLAGEDATRDWLAGLKQNSLVYSSNITVMAATNVGQVPVGVMYHYYWFQDQAESGENSDNTQLHYFKNEDPGAFVSLSAAGILGSSDNADAAQQFVAFLTGPEGQQAMADSDALEYTVNPDITPNDALPPLADLEAPAVDPMTLNGAEVVELMQEAGLL